MDHREHSVYFDDYNTWDMWHLVPSGRPTPSIPEPRTNMVSVPGMNGSLDLSEALTGTMLFENRELDCDFILVDQGRDWMDTYMDVVEKLHGKRMTIRLVDDPGWYYVGRVSVSEFSSNSDYSSINITAELDPYKYSEETYESECKISMLDLTGSTTRSIVLNLGYTSKAGSLNPKETTVNGSIGFSNTPSLQNRGGVSEPRIMVDLEGMVHSVSSITKMGLAYNGQTVEVENVDPVTPFVLVNGKYCVITFYVTASDWTIYDSTDFIYINIRWQERRI